VDPCGELGINVEIPKLEGTNCFLRSILLSEIMKNVDHTMKIIVRVGIFHCVNVISIGPSWLTIYYYSIS